MLGYFVYTTKVLTNVASPTIAKTLSVSKRTS